jgi:hypothetical protein
VHNTFPEEPSLGIAQNRKIGKANNLKVFGSNKTKGPKQDYQNWLRSPICLREENHSFYILRIPLSLIIFIHDLIHANDRYLAFTIEK